jgi:hypothetical protein
VDNACLPACSSSGASGQGTNNDGILCDVLLPVESFSFHAKYQNKAVELTWEVAQESQHFAYYQVQKSRNGRT